MRLLLICSSLGVVTACTSPATDPCEDATSGTVCRWAGTGNSGLNIETAGSHRLDSQIYFPSDLTFGPDGRAYIADFNNHLVRRVEHDDTMHTVLGADYEGDGSPGETDRLPVCAPEGAYGIEIAMNHPTDLKFGPDGFLYVAAWHNNKIRVVDPDTMRGYTLVGDGYGFTNDGSTACDALFNQPKTLVFGPDGTIYTIDQRNARIRTLSPGALDQKIVRTLAGIGALGDSGDGGPALAAEFGFELTATPRPSGALALHGSHLYVADSLNNRIRRIDLVSGMIECVAGCGAGPGYTGDGGPAMNAQFDFPMDLELGPDGRLYVADRYNHAIRAIDLETGLIETVIGNGRCSTRTESCPDRATTDTAGLNEPYGIAFDLEGALYVSDTHNSRILKVVP